MDNIQLTAEERRKANAVFLVGSMNRPEQVRMYWNLIGAISSIVTNNGENAKEWMIDELENAFFLLRDASQIGI